MNPSNFVTRRACFRLYYYTLFPTQTSLVPNDLILSKVTSLLARSNDVAKFQHDIPSILHLRSNIRAIDTRHNIVVALLGLLISYPG
jgi:hypothetical protein